MANNCEIVVGHGMPDPLLPPRDGREAVAVLHQHHPTGLASLIAARAGLRASVRELPERDDAKALSVVGELYEWLANENLGRHDTIIGVGGGALTDVAGFVAATWMRGVESVLVPTTLLGAVDAAIGGKTAINVTTAMPGVGKNLVGAFWDPTRVIVDLDTLAANPPNLILEGTAEILKAGLLGDAEIVEAYVRHGSEAALDLVVPRAIAVKASIVSEDPREGGRRALLNFGHTIGHGIEAVTGMPHGHAVAVGMVAESAVSAWRYGFDHAWLSALIFSLGLPVAVSGVSAAAVTRWIARDKKRSIEGTRMVLLRGVCDSVLESVTDEEVAFALRSIGAT